MQIGNFALIDSRNTLSHTQCMFFPHLFSSSHIFSIFPYILLLLFGSRSLLACTVTNDLLSMAKQLISIDCFLSSAAFACLQYDYCVFSFISFTIACQTKRAHTIAVSTSNNAESMEKSTAREAATERMNRWQSSFQARLLMKLPIDLISFHPPKNVTHKFIENICAIHVMNASRNGLNLAKIHSFHLISGSLFAAHSMFSYSYSIRSFLDYFKCVCRCGLGFANSFLLSSSLFIHGISKRTNHIRITNNSSTKSSQRIINGRLFV